METITKEDGTTVDVYTAEELEAQKQEAIEQYKAENPDKSEEFTKLQKDLEDAKTALDKFKDKDLNFGKLREQKEQAEKKVSELKADFEAKLETTKKEIFEGVQKDYYNDTLKTLSGGDEEVKKKIEYHYKRLGDTAATKEEIGNKLRDAYLLATKQDAPDALNTTVLSSGGSGKLNIKSDKKFTPEEKALAQKLAQAGGMKLEDKDFQ